MSRKSAVVAIVFLTIANGAHAGVGDHAGGALSSLKFMSPVEKAQYYSLDDNSNYCWYNNGWQGPGWYLCGDEWLNGFGWGGPYGWNGWGGGNLIRRHGSHGIGVWHPGAPNKVFGGAASPGLGPGVPPTSPAFQGGGVPAFHRFGGGGGAFHGPGTGGAPASPAFQGGGVPAFHGFGGGGGFHGPGPGAPASPGFQGGGVRFPWLWRWRGFSWLWRRWRFSWRRRWSLLVRWTRRRRPSLKAKARALRRVEQREHAHEGDDDAAEHDFRRAGRA